MEMLHLRCPSPLDMVWLFCAFVAFVLHMIGTMFPYWWLVHETDEHAAHTGITFHYGIWAIVDCRNNTCITTSSKMEGDRAWLLGPAVLILIADLLLLVVLVITCLNLLHEKHRIVLWKLSALLSGGAGGVIILAVLIFCKKKAGLRPSQALDTSDGKPDWALFLSASASIVAVMNGIISSCGASKAVKRSEAKERKGIYDMDIGALDVNVDSVCRNGWGYTGTCGSGANNLNKLATVKGEEACCPSETV